jgi:hypothetical protein
VGGDGGQKDQGGAGVAADLGGTGCNYAEVPLTSGPSEGVQKSAVEVVFVHWGVPVARGNAEGSDSALDSDP